MTVTRRVVLAGGLAAGALYAAPRLAAAFASPEVVVWQGQALGAPARIILHHPDRKMAERLVRDCAREAERLEAIFSLYRPDSELSRLNRAGALAMPSPEMIALLAICQSCWRLSDGLFDPTVQPLWQCLHRHFSAPNPDPGGPSRADWDRALARVGFENVLFDANRIAFARPSMALTLNGIAQGYVTDRVTALLKAGSVEHALVDMGEYRAIGTQPDGRPWRIGIADLEAGASPDEFVDIEEKSLATSSFEGFRFDDRGRFNHLLNPKTGYSASLYTRVTVVAPDAARADAWATAFNLMDERQIRAALRRLPDVTVLARRRSGESLTLSAASIIPVSFRGVV